MRKASGFGKKRVLRAIVALLVLCILVSPLACACPPTPTPTPTPEETVLWGSGIYSDGDYIPFPTPFVDGDWFLTPFPQSPVVLVSADKGGVPVIASASSVSPSGFDLALIDDEGNPVTSAEVNWIAIGIGPPNPGVAIQRGWGSYSNGASIPFTYPYFIQPPVVVTSADPSIGTAVNIAANGFDIALIDDGGGTTTAEVDWIALTVGVSTPNTLIQYQRGLSGNGAHITFDTEFGPWPVVIVNARRFGEPLIACAEKVTTAGFDLAIIDHGGNPVTGVWVHWIAIGPPIPPPVTPPPYTPEPSPTPEGTPRP